MPFFHILIQHEREKKTNSKLTNLPLNTYEIDFSEEALKAFLVPFKKGLPLQVDDEVIAPKLLREIEIRSTEEDGESLIPSLQAQHQAKLAREEAENRTARIVVIGMSIFNQFHPTRAVFLQGQECTEKFLVPFVGNIEEATQSNKIPLTDSSENFSRTPEQIVSTRFAVLEHIYNISGASSLRYFHWREIALELNRTYDLPEYESAEIIHHLGRKKLLEENGPMVAISRMGVEEYERKKRSPSEPTANFPQTVKYIMNIKNVNNSAIMQNSDNSSQAVNVNQNTESARELLDALTKFRSLLPNIELEDNDRDEIDVAAETLQIEVSKPEPDKKRSRVQAKALTALLGNFGLNIAANAASVPVVAELHRLLPACF